MHDFPKKSLQLCQKFVLFDPKIGNWVTSDPWRNPSEPFQVLPGISAVHQDGRIRPGDLALLPSLAGTAWVGVAWKRREQR